MKIKSQRDFWSGLMFVCVGATFAIGALNYTFGSSARPGPAYFPFGLGVLLALLGSTVLFKSLTIEVEGGDPIGAIAWRPLIVVVAAVALFGFLLPRLGFVISLPLLILLTGLAGADFRWRDALVSAVVLTAGCWLVFIVGLKLSIPVWPAVPLFGG